jgi:ubiquinone/menaquinone biosynthesis C-methylase UbiE
MQERRNCTTDSCENHRRVPGNASTKRSHTSAAHGDLEAARAFEERRFRGPIGRMVAAEQKRVLANMIGRIHDRTILDVGTGFGRTAITLASGAAIVTAVDSSDVLLAEARRRAADQVVKVNFLRGDAHALEFTARSFDVVVCMGVLLSTRDWRQCLAETCRVADRLVIFDYPSASSAAMIHALIRRLFRRGRYRVLTRGAIDEALRHAHFRVRSVHRQYVLPMWFHRAFGSRRLTSRIEGLLDRLGLLKVFGTPVTICAERTS